MLLNMLSRLLIADVLGGYHAVLMGLADARPAAAAATRRKREGDMPLFCLLTLIVNRLA